MIKNSLPNFLFILMGVLLFNVKLSAQFIYRINGETGVYNSSGFETNNNGNIFASVEGYTGYKFQQNNRRASVRLRIRPELYGITDNLSSLKFKASADYYQYGKNYNWGINIDRQLFTFKNYKQNISYDQFLLTGNVSGTFLYGLPVDLNFGYSFQKLNVPAKQNLNMLFFNPRLYEIRNRYFKIGYGLYIEKFLLKNDMTDKNHEINSNKGWRYGPEVSLNYLKNFILNFDYRFLFQNSQFTFYPSIEQWIRLIGGKIISEKWSVFLLVDYYFRNFKLKTSAKGNDNILYTPTNFENRIYAKLGFDVSDNFELYLKPGYFKENLFSNKYSFEGWDVLIGFEVGN